MKRASVANSTTNWPSRYGAPTPGTAYLFILALHVGPALTLAPDGVVAGSAGRVAVVDIAGCHASVRLILLEQLAPVGDARGPAEPQQDAEEGGVS